MAHAPPSAAHEQPAADLELNQRIADRLRQAADLLEQQGANPFRVGAYRRAADTVSGLGQSVAEILRPRGWTGSLCVPESATRWPPPSTRWRAPGAGGSSSACVGA